MPYAHFCLCKMMFDKCCVCKIMRKDASLHIFPTNEQRLKEWLMCINRDDLSELTKEQISKLFICHKHFEKRFHLRSCPNRITTKAFPTLFTETEMSSGITSRHYDENVDPLLDHNYSRKRHFDHSYCKTEPLKEINSSGSNIMLQSILDKPPSTFVIEVVGSTEFNETPGPSIVSPIRKDIEVARSAEITETPGPSIVSPVRKDIGFKILKRGIKNKPMKKRLVKKLSDLDPLCLKLHKEHKRATRTVNFLKRALKFSTDNSFIKMTKNMNPYAKTFIKMQITLSKRKNKGRRFSLKEKLIALSIMKQSPKCYRFLQKIFILPSSTTLNRMVGNLDIQTGS